MCIDHFSEQFIVRFDSAKRDDGSILTVQRSAPKLTKDAYPSIFPNCPSYLSNEPPAKRKKPEQRRAEVEERDNIAFCSWQEEDKIKDFADFSAKCLVKLSQGWFHKLHTPDNTDHYWSFYRIADSTTTKPTLLSAVRIFNDLHVEIFTEKLGKTW